LRIFDVEGVDPALFSAAWVFQLLDTNRIDAEEVEGFLL
jgi:hypothetical protein